MNKIILVLLCFFIATSVFPVCIQQVSQALKVPQYLSNSQFGVSVDFDILTPQAPGSGEGGSGVL
jgi:hypothetical protein